jgi:demethylmenaquinone methyltransferase/2-methoxy-6-polyprenyl-1,4-benzoquinol methylase
MWLYERIFSSMNHDLTIYYDLRANEYDNVYAIPAEQPDRATAAGIIQKLFPDKSVLEIACGTGYWTRQIAHAASSVFAIDINESVVTLAKQKNHSDHVSFAVADMFSLKVNTKYDALFGGFIWSHILLEQLDYFLQTLTNFIKSDGLIVFIDSKQIKGGIHDSANTSKVDKFGNTFQTRRLENGSTHLVLKNFPTREFLFQKLSVVATDIQYIELTHYWLAVGKLQE